MFPIAFIRRYCTPCSRRWNKKIVLHSFQLQQRSRMDFKFQKSFRAPARIILLAAATLCVCSVVTSSPSSKFDVKDFSIFSFHPHSVIIATRADAVQRLKDQNITPEQDKVIHAVENNSSYADCGVANTIVMQSISENNKIVGGEETAPNEFPWQALLVVEIANNEDKICGGSLINNEWILTAAHCLVLTTGQQIERISVYLGVHNFVATNEINRKMYLANNYVIHPDSNVNNFSNDIALIKLSTTVTFSQYIRPICLASSTEPDYTNEPATVAGWGFTSDGLSASLSPVLRKVTVPVISNSVCNNTYPGMITEKIICTSGANRSGPCKSDSGGPLIFKESNGKWKQIGIVSFGSSLGCQKNFPSGYTRISSYSSWIQGVIAPMTPTKSPSTVTSTPVPITSPYSSGPHTYAFLSVSLVIFSFAFSFLGGDKLLSS